MSRSSSEASLSSTILKESDHEDDLLNESQARQQHSPTRSPQSPLSGNAKFKLQHENVKRKRTISGAGLPPEMSPRKVSRPKPDKVASSKSSPSSTSVASSVVATPRRSFWSTSYREEAASDSSTQNVQSDRKSAPEEKSADGFSRARQRQANTSSQFSPRSQQGPAPGSSRHKDATSGLERTLASTSSRRMTLKEKPAVKLGTLRHGHESSTFQSTSKRKQGTPKKAVKKPVGYKVLREIGRHRSSTVTLIPCLPFARVVREILFRITGDDFKMQKLALKALHEASEAFIVALLEGANVLARHSHRVTIMSRDLATLLTLIKRYGNLQGCLS